MQTGTPPATAAPTDSAQTAAADSISRADSIADWTITERARLRACVASLAHELDPPAVERFAAASGTKADPLPDSAAVLASTPVYRTGEDPARARRAGWPVRMPDPQIGSILPCNRVVTYYGNPLSPRMGVLGEFERGEMLRRFRETVAHWDAADPTHPVQPALQLVTLVAQSEPGRNGEYNLWMPDSIIERVYGWAQDAGAILILDLQVGTSTVQAELPLLEEFLTRPDVHLAIDPEFAMQHERRPGEYMGSLDAADINFASRYLAGLVRAHDLPPKLLVVHRFTGPMVTNAHAIELRPEVQVVMHMDGWGSAAHKRHSYERFIVREPVQFPGFKIFYHNDVREPGWRLMTPEDVLRLMPAPLYIQYQ